MPKGVNPGEPIRQIVIDEANKDLIGSGRAKFVKPPRSGSGGMRDK